MAKSLSITDRFGFRNVQLLENEDCELGRGSYGVVYKVKCDQLFCAAKVLHSTLFQTSEPTVRIEQQFEQEINLLREIRHPNIVQFLGVCRHPHTDLPILLMELMDINLTKFLEQSTDPLPLHVQVNIAHDVAQAVAYLHNHDIIHRDLSSNNVLLIGNCRAKVTDFGVAKLQEVQARTQATLTSNPGTNVYMPPEACIAKITGRTEYTVKLDIFSCGVLFVQLVTREFPDPSGPKIKETPTGELRKVPEVSRRENHIDSIEVTHPLRKIALECLEDAEEKRPSSDKLCSSLIAVKESKAYEESLHPALSQHSDHEENTGNLMEQVHKLRRASIVLREKNETLANELQENKHAVATLTSSVEEKDIELKKLSGKIRILRKRASGPLNLQWTQQSRAPDPTRGESVAVTDGVVYFCDAVHNNRVLMYTSSTQLWRKLPTCPKLCFSIAVVNGALTAIGGKNAAMVDQKSLLCLPEHRHLDPHEISQLMWNEKFPSMHHFHNNPAVATTDSSLIVAGGFSSDKHSVAVEVLDTNAVSWTVVSTLPHPLQQAVAAICGSRIYIGGGIPVGKNSGTKSVIMCELDKLLSTASAQLSAGSVHRSRSHSKWTYIANLPVQMFSLVTLQDQLLAIGGCIKNFRDDTTSDVYQYDVHNDSWNVISHMNVKRFRCFAAALPDETLMVVGGQIGHEILNDVETASFI